MKKFYLDIIMLILFMLVMSFNFLPRQMHEILGIALFITMICHFIWNFQSFKKKKSNLSKFVDILLIFCLLIITCTGICISNFLFNGLLDMELRKIILIHQLHSSISYLMLILIGLHLGFNWGGFKQRCKFLINIAIPQIISKMFIIFFMAIGIYGSFANQVGDRLMMEHIFATDATTLPFVIFLLLMIGILSIYIMIGYLISSKISR